MPLASWFNLILYTLQYDIFRFGLFDDNRQYITIKITFYFSEIRFRCIKIKDINHLNALKKKLLMITCGMGY